MNLEQLKSSAHLLWCRRCRQKRDAKYMHTVAREEPMKKKRKTKVPKNADPKVLPDPERWLPKYERSTYKRREKKRDRERNVGRGTQGASAADANTADKL